MNKKAPAKGKAIEEYLLSTKLYCGVCGGLMVGESGRSRNGSVHFYYKCGNAKRRKGCKRRKAIRKHWIEKLVVIFTVNNVLQDDVIDRIADAMTAMQYQEDTTVPALKAQLKECEKGIVNLVNAIQAGILTASTKERLEQLEKEREALTINIAQAQLARPKYTKEQIVDWISQFKYGNINDPAYQKQIIETFVNSVYLYEDHLILNYNYKNGTETFSLDEVNEAFGSDLKNFAPPRSASERVRIFLCISTVSGFRRVVSILRIFAFYPHLTHNTRVKHGRIGTQKMGQNSGGLFPSAVLAETLDVVFHALCALPLHADGGVGVGSERKACGGVTQIFLHGFDVIPGFQAVDREGVAQIVELHVLQADLFHDRLVVAVHRLIRHEAPELVGEDQIVRVLEGRTLLSRLLRDPLPARVAGSNLVPDLCPRCKAEGLRFYVLGGAEEALAEALAAMECKAGFPMPIAGSDHSFVKLGEEQPEIVERINAAKPDILFVALGNPKQELWLARNAAALDVPVALGIGGSFNFVAGRVKRAPRWMQKCSLEWVHRIAQEPGRLWRRYAYGLVKFSWLSLLHLLGGYRR